MMGDSKRAELLRRAESAVLDGLFDSADRYLEALRALVMSGPAPVDWESIPHEQRQSYTTTHCERCEQRTLHMRGQGQMMCAQHNVWTEDGWVVRTVQM